MANQKELIIDGREIGLNHPPYIVAELSANHNGSLSRALLSIETAKKMGADAIKLQTYTEDSLTIDSDKEDFQITDGLWNGYSLYQLYQEAKTPYEWHSALFAKAHEIGITVFSTPFDEEGVELLEKLNVPAYKVASFECVDIPLIACIARTKKPMIISTGMANLDEIGEAVETASSNGCKDIILLHCLSSYPAPLEQSNLRTIPDLAKQFGVITGLSDHTMGVTAAVASVALGACMIEKHFTLSRQDKGPDSDFSLEPEELKALCSEAKNAWFCLGEAGYNRKPAELPNLRFRRSLYAIKDIVPGEQLTKENIRSIRPGYGLPPKHFDTILGNKAKDYIERGTPLSWELIEVTGCAS